jgi:hypothetical protein
VVECAICPIQRSNGREKSGIADTYKIRKTAGFPLAAMRRRNPSTKQLQGLSLRLACASPGLLVARQQYSPDISCLELLMLILSILIFTPSLSGHF